VFESAEQCLPSLDATLDFRDHGCEVGVAGVEAVDGLLKFALKGLHLVVEGGNALGLGREGGELSGSGGGSWVGADSVQGCGIVADVFNNLVGSGL
jgi:hypothetical protein